MDTVDMVDTDAIMVKGLLSLNLTMVEDTVDTAVDMGDTVDTDVDMDTMDKSILRIKSLAVVNLTQSNKKATYNKFCVPICVQDLSDSESNRN